MSSRAKRHSGIHSYHDLLGRCAVFFPSGHDNYFLAYLYRLVVRLPGVCPILFVYTAYAYLCLNAERIKALAKKYESISDSSVNRLIHRNVSNRLVCVKYRFVNKIAVAGLEIYVAVILYLKIIRYHIHNGNSIVKGVKTYLDLYLSPFGLASPILTCIIFIRHFKVLYFLSNILLKNPFFFE